MSITTDRNDPDLGHGSNSEKVPQNKKYLVLSPEELAKGFVNPYRDAYVHKVCGTTTVMRSREICETYARDPKFYGATYCCGCMKHVPVSECLWEGTDEEVGSLHKWPDKNLSDTQD